MYENKQQFWNKIGKIRFWRLNKKEKIKTVNLSALQTKFKNDHTLGHEQYFNMSRINR